MNAVKKTSAFLAAILLAVPLFSGNVFAAEAKVFKWDFFVCVPLNHVRNIGLIQLAANVKERTGGQLDITLRPAGEVPYKGPEAITIAIDGSVQISDANTANIAGTSQVGAIPTYPFLCDNWADFRKLVDAIYPIFEEEMAKNNVKTWFFLPEPLQYMYGQGEVITKLADMKGRSMRGQNSYMQAFAKQVGANSIAITSNEIPQAISRSVIDIFVTGSFSTVAGSFYELIDWVLKIPFSTNGSFVIVNGEAWNSLPQEYRDILEDEAVKLVESYWKSFITEEDQKALEIIGGYRNGKVKVYESNETIMKEGKALMKDFYVKWATEAGPYGARAIEAAFKALGQ